MIERTIYKEEHDVFRSSFRKFLEKEVLPHREEWEKAGMVSREIWKKCGEQGYLCPWVEEKYGGAGADFYYAAVIAEELAHLGESGLILSLHSDIVVPYIYSYGNEAQKEKWIPGCVTGEKITAVAMTEPGAGSDLASMRCTAKQDGDNWIINGQKTFISNGMLCDLCVVACRTETAKGQGHGGFSLFVVEYGTPGFVKLRKLDKIGMKSQDTAELLFEDCRVPAFNLLGELGKGFYYLMEKLQQERLMVAIGAQAASETALQMTIDYAKTRVAFGKPLTKFQVLKFKIVEMATEIAIGRVFVDNLIKAHAEKKNVAMETCMAKWWTTEMLKRVVDDGLQIHGGYGYMVEYPIAKAFVDARVQTIFAGTTEIMKEIIGRLMGL